MVHKTAQREHSSEKETARLEAFSDGVFAFAITLLAMELKVPHLPEGEATASALREPAARDGGLACPLDLLGHRPRLD